MKIQFNVLETSTGKISVSLDNGENYTEYNVADVKDTGIELDDSQDFSKIIIKGESTTLSNLNVLKNIDIEGLKKDITLQTKLVEENGDVVADTGFDGLEKVTVAVPEKTLKDVEFTENGNYTPDGTFDGYGSVLVKVPTTETEELSVVENGEYVAEDGKAYSKVTVAVPETEVDYSGYVEKQYIDLVAYSASIPDDLTEFDISVAYPSSLGASSEDEYLDNFIDAAGNSLYDYVTVADLLRTLSTETEIQLYTTISGTHHSGLTVQGFPSMFFVRFVVRADEA